MKTHSKKENKTTKRVLQALLVACAIAWLPACELMHPFDHQGSWGQRSCVASIDCGKLVELACGDDDKCSDSLSCQAARRLEADGDGNVCHSAWCDLGESYKECGIFD